MPISTGLLQQCTLKSMILANDQNPPTSCQTGYDCNLIPIQSQLSQCRELLQTWESMKPVVRQRQLLQVLETCTMGNTNLKEARLLQKLG